MPGSFIDTNVLIYLLSSDVVKAERAETLLREGGTVNVQILNELANVTRRKLEFEWTEIHSFLADIRSLLNVLPTDVAVHDQGLRIAEKYQLSIYDSMIVGAALLCDCDVLWSEDMHHGLIIDDKLNIRNPFA